MMQQIEPKISQIKKMPIGKESKEGTNSMIYETCYKSFHTLILIMDMVNRGDSKETIWNVYDEIYNGENNAYHEPKFVITSATSENKD